MFICQFGMLNCQCHRSARVYKQTYDACCISTLAAKCTEQICLDTHESLFEDLRQVLRLGF